LRAGGGRCRRAGRPAFGTRTGASGGADPDTIRASAAEPVAATTPARQPEGPMQVVISIGSQRLWLYDKNGLLETSTISTGVGGYPTADGRVRRHRQRGDALLQHLRRRLDAVHAAPHHVRRRHAFRHGHGAPRLAWLRAPAPSLRHQALQASPGSGRARDHLPPTSRRPRKLPTPACSCASPPRSLSRSTPPAPRASLLRPATDMTAARGQREGWQDHGRNAPWELQKAADLHPRQQGRRQDDRAVTASARYSRRPSPSAIPDRPLGTHVYTALEFRDGGDAMRWQAVSVSASRAERGQLAQGVARASRNESEPPYPEASGPASVGVRGARPHRPAAGTRLERISQMLSPGTSLIVSDHGHKPRDARRRHRLHRPGRARVFLTLDGISAVTPNLPLSIPGFMPGIQHTARSGVSRMDGSR